MKSYRSVQFKKCKLCNKVWQIETQSDRIKKFCSRGCYYKYIRGIKNPMWKLKIRKECLNCNISFEVWPSHSFRRFCSKRCSNQYRGN